MNLEVRCKESQASNWVIAGMNRRFTNKEEFEQRIDVICLEVASELNLIFEHKDDDTLFFRDMN